MPSLTNIEMKFQILLDNPSQSYFAGQIVSGRVILDLDKEKKVSGLKLKCIGEAQVHWTERDTYSTGTGNNHRTHYRTVHYRSDDKYFEHKIFLVGQHNSSQFVMPVGFQSFPFAFQLPLGIPSSFQGHHGFVQYYLAATIKRSWKFDLDTKLMFTINGLVDLNIYAGAALACEFLKEKYLCCLSCKSGPLGFTFKMNRAGFVPGETLQFVTDLYNTSDRHLPGTCVRLIRVTSFYARGKVRTSNTIILEKNGRGVEPGENEILQGDGMQIPPIPPTDLGGCNIIKVKYHLEVVLKVPNGLDLSGTAPIIIGTIPFRNNFQELMSHSGTRIGQIRPRPGLSTPEIQPSAPFVPGMFGYPDMPPPTYEEAMKGEKFEGIEPSTYGDEIDGGGGDTTPSTPTDQNFLPKYATYGWNSRST